MRPPTSSKHEESNSPSTLTLMAGPMVSTTLRTWRSQKTLSPETWLATIRDWSPSPPSPSPRTAEALHVSIDRRSLLALARPPVRRGSNPDATTSSAYCDPSGGEIRVSAPTWYSVESVHDHAGRAGPVGLAINDDPDTLTFVNVWTTRDRSQQRHLVNAMRQELATMMRKPGIQAMAFLLDSIGTSLAVYARWSSLEAFDRAITQDPSAQAGREALGQWGTAAADTYRVVDVHCPTQRTQDLQVGTDSPATARKGQQ
jgi:hypothetical protein